MRHPSGRHKSSCAKNPYSSLLRCPPCADRPPAGRGLQATFLSSFRPHFGTDALELSAPTQAAFVRVTFRMRSYLASTSPLGRFLAHLGHRSPYSVSNAQFQRVAICLACCWKTSQMIAWNRSASGLAIPADTARSCRCPPLHWTIRDGRTICGGVPPG